ncbi:hypothetical protein ACFWFI_01950 [Streptomyces sp. NPDC060209]|uniref:hypothetical protein n=1 Tax=Streptomyces sp. NPDC060209 TaxID=3347073 RepID=UPI00364A6075
MAAQVGGEHAVERAVGQQRAQAHDQGGIPAGAYMEVTGHLGADGLHATAEELVATLVRMVANAGGTA